MNKMVPLSVPLSCYAELSNNKSGDQGIKHETKYFPIVGAAPTACDSLHLYLFNLQTKWSCYLSSKILSHPGDGISN